MNANEREWGKAAKEHCKERGGGQTQSKSKSKACTGGAVQGRGGATMNLKKGINRRDRREHKEHKIDVISFGVWRLPQVLSIIVMAEGQGGGKGITAENREENTKSIKSMKDVRTLSDQVRQIAYDIHVYHGHGHIGNYLADLLVEDGLIVELKVAKARFCKGFCVNGFVFCFSVRENSEPPAAS